MKKTACAMAVLVLALLVTLTALASEGQRDYAEELAGLNGKKIGVITGTIHDGLAKTWFPDSPVDYYNDLADLPIALSSGQIDAFTCEERNAVGIVSEQDGLRYFPLPMDRLETAFAFRKDEEGARLRDQMNAFLKKIREDGTFSRIEENWLTGRENPDPIDWEGLSGPVLTYAVTGSLPPFSFMMDGELAGYDVDMAVRFCREYGYDIDVQIMSATAMLAGMATGRYDFAGDAISVTEERKESVYFSDPNYDSIVVVMTRDASFGKKGAESGTLEQYEGANFAMVEGSAYESMLTERFENPQIQYFQNIADQFTALSAGQVDAVPQGRMTAEVLMRVNPKLSYVDEVLGVIPSVFAFPQDERGKELAEQMNAYLKKMREDGSLDAMILKWRSDENTEKTVDYSGLTGRERTLELATDGANEPFSYVRDGVCVGLDLDLVAGFCREYGYGLHINTMNFGGILAGVNSGKYDIGFTCIGYTKERAENATFSDPYLDNEIVLMISSGDEKAKGGFWQSLTESFRKTFIRENRWKLIVQGIGTTAFITICAAVLGTVLGFGVCLLRRGSNPFFRGFARIYIRILQGTPIVVLLMILFYVIFARTHFSGEMVAIIGFGLNFAAYAAEEFRTGMDAVDIGQIEAAYAIGYTRTQSFFHIVMPQAAQHFLPVFKGEVVSLVKSTSVVGYIAVQDLTKMSDIIRSRTYEAFFPLIATAAIYFAITWILTMLLRRVEIRMEPNRKNRRVRGVVTEKRI